MQITLQAIDTDTVTIIRNFVVEAQATPGRHSIFIASPAGLVGEARKAEWTERLRFVRRLVMTIRDAYQGNWTYIAVEAQPERPAMENKVGKYDHLLQ